MTAKASNIWAVVTCCIKDSVLQTVSSQNKLLKIICESGSNLIKSSLPLVFVCCDVVRLVSKKICCF